MCQTKRYLIFAVLLLFQTSILAGNVDGDNEWTIDDSTYYKLQSDQRESTLTPRCICGFSSWSCCLKQKPQRVQGMPSRIEDRGYRRLPEKIMQRMTSSRQKRKATTSLQETMGNQPKMNFL